jgi:hypothetical protein
LTQGSSLGPDRAARLLRALGVARNADEQAIKDKDTRAAPVTVRLVTIPPPQGATDTIPDPVASVVPPDALSRRRPDVSAIGRS